MTARARCGSTRRTRPRAAWDDVRGAPCVLEGLVRVRRRILDPALPRRRRRDRHLGRAAQPPRGRHPRRLERARRRRSCAARDRRGRGAGAARSPTRSTMSACWRWSFSRSAARRSSTRWRRASTIAATGRSRARAPRSSRTISARSAACRSARTDLAAPRVEMRNLVGDDADGWARDPRRPRRPPPPLRQEARRAPAARWATSPGCSERLRPRQSPGEGPVHQLSAQCAGQLARRRSPRSAGRAARAAGGPGRRRRPPPRRNCPG